MVDANGSSAYTIPVSTVCDSCPGTDDCTTAIYITALTAALDVFAESAPDSGASTDNLAPGAPTGTNVSGPSLLTWSPPSDGDIEYFTVYGWSDTTAAQPVDTTSATTFDLSGTDFAYFRVTATDSCGAEGAASEWAQDPTGIHLPPIQADFLLSGAVPMPFRDVTRFRFARPTPGHVHIAVHDLQGRLVRTLVDETISAGERSVIWSARDTRGHRVTSGIYFVVMHADDFTAIRKVVVLR